MDAYDTAVLSYALATAASKIKPGLLGIAPNIPNRGGVAPSGGVAPAGTAVSTGVGGGGGAGGNGGVSLAEESLTPPAPRRAAADGEGRPNQEALVKMLAALEASFLNRVPVQLPQMLDMCALKQLDTQSIVLLDGLQCELRQICKTHPGKPYFLVLSDSDDIQISGLLKKDQVLRILSELYNKFNMTDTANFLRSYLVSS